MAEYEKWMEPKKCIWNPKFIKWTPLQKGFCTWRKELTSHFTHNMVQTTPLSDKTLFEKHRSVIPHRHPGLATPGKANAHADNIICF